LRTLLLSQNEIVISDVKYEVFMALITYLYTGIVDIAAENQLALLDIAKFYEISKLVNICEREVSVETRLREISNTEVGEDLDKSVNSNEFSDFCLIVNEDKRVHCHKVILAARSTYFSAMLSGSMQESRAKEVKLYDLEEAVLLSVMHFLYAEKLVVTSDIAVDLLEAANLYRLDQLKSMCEATTQQWVDKDNAVYLLQAAELTGSYMLKEFCSSYILKQLDLINDISGITEVIEDIAFRKKLLRIKTMSCHPEDSESDRDDKSPKVAV